MASVIKLKRSSTASAIPADDSLQAGELAINLADKKLFSARSNGEVITISGDQYNMTTSGNATQGTVNLTVDNDALSNDAVNFVGTGAITVSGNSTQITIDSSSDSYDFATVANTSSANLVLGGDADTDTVKIEGDDHITVAAGNTSHVTVKLGNAVSVASVQTSGNTVVGGDADIAGEVNAATGAIVGDLTVGGDTDITGEVNAATAAIVGDATIGGDADITGEVNAATGAITTSLVVGSGGQAPTINSTAINVGNDGGQVLVGNNNVTLGNSTVNTSLSTTAVFTDGTLRAEGATDLNSTLAVSGIATFENTTNSTSNTTGGVKVSGGIGVVKSATVGEDLTVHGDADIKGGVILGDATSDRIEVKGRVNTHIVPESSATRSLGTSTLKWDLYADDARTRLLTVSEDATVDGDLDVAGFGNVGYPFTVSNTTTKAIEAVISGTNRIVRLGNTIPTSTAADDRLIVRSAVGNSTIGLLPLHGNNVPLGDANHRWVFTANTGDFSGNLDVAGDLDVTDTTNSTSTSTGAIKTTGGVGIAKSVQVGEKITTVGDIVAGADVDISGEVNAATAAIVGAATVGGTLDVTGKLSADGAVDLGNASGDTIRILGSVGGNSTVGIIPSANGRILGTNLKRFAGQLTTLNASGDITAGSDVDITGEVNAASAAIVGAATVGSTLDVTGVITASDDVDISGEVNAATAAIVGAATIGGDITGSGDLDLSSEANVSTLRVRSTSSFESANINFGNSTIYANLSANTTQTEFEVDRVQATDLVITGSASLPEDTTLTSASLGTANLSVTDTAEFTAATAGASIKFGNGNDRLILNFANAVANANFVADATTRDVGTDSLRWGEGHFESLLQVGGSSGIVMSDGGGASQANVTADNIFARDELVGASTSDRNLKDSVLTIDTALGKIEQIGGYEFTWNSNIQDERIGKRDYGVIAQEVEEILPHAVNINSRGYKTVNYNSLIPLLIEAVKELSGRVEELERDKRKEENLDG